MAKTNSIACQLTERQVKRTIDKLAALKAQIANLEAEADELSDLLKLQGNGVYFGNAHKYIVAEVTTQRLDAKLAQSYLTPGQIIECTKTCHSITGRLYAL